MALQIFQCPSPSKESTLKPAAVTRGHASPSPDKDDFHEEICPEVGHVSGRSRKYRSQSEHYLRLCSGIVRALLFSLQYLRVPVFGVLRDMQGVL